MSEYAGNKSTYFYTLLALSLVLIVDALVMGIVFPMMGALFINPHESIVSAGMSMAGRDMLYSLTMGIFFLCAILGAPFLGDLSDIIGRRKVLLISLIAGGISCIAAALAVSLKLVWLLILARAAAGLASGNQTLANAAMIDLSTPENKARNIALITLASCVGFAFGPLIGGVFSDNHLFKYLTPATPFWIAAGASFITAIAIFLTFHETFLQSEAFQRKTLQFTKGLTLLIDGFRHLTLHRWIWVHLCAQLGWGIYFQSISLLLAQHYHYTTGKIGLFMAWLAVLFAAGVGLIVPAALKRVELKPLLLFGLFSAAVSMMLTMLWMHSVLAQWFILVPFIVGQVFIYTVTITQVSNAVDKSSQGWAMGVAVAVGSFAWGMAAFIVGIGISVSIYLPFIAALLLFIACYFLVTRHRVH